MNQEIAHSGVSKIERYKWQSKGQPGKLQYIKKGQIQINFEYQREANSPKVLELAKNWSWIGCGAISVAYRDGIYYAMDGQHRVLAAMKRSDIDELPCVVFETSSLSEEAIGFLDLNTNRKVVTALAKHKAKVAAADELALFVQNEVQKCNLHITSDGRASRGIKCIATCNRMAEQDERSFSAALALAAEMACAENGPVRDRVLEGLFFLHRKLRNSDLHDARLRERIKKTGSAKLLEYANKASAYYSGGGAKVWAEGMLNIINHGLRNKYELQTGQYKEADALPLDSDSSVLQMSGGSYKPQSTWATGLGARQ